MTTKNIFTEEEKKEARQKTWEIVKTILTLGLTHLFKWLNKVITKK